MPVARGSVGEIARHRWEQSVAAVCGVVQVAVIMPSIYGWHIPALLWTITVLGLGFIVHGLPRDVCYDRPSSFEAKIHLTDGTSEVRSHPI